MRARGARPLDAVVVVLEDQAFLRLQLQPLDGGQVDFWVGLGARTSTVGQEEIKILQEVGLLHHRFDRRAHGIGAHDHALALPLQAAGERIRDGRPAGISRR